MNAAQPELHSSTDVGAALPVIQGLARLHDYVALLDGRGRVVWMSDALASTCGGLRSYRGQPWLETFVRPTRGDRLAAALARGGQVLNEPVELCDTHGDTIPARVSAARVGHCPDGGPVVAIFRTDSADAQRELRHTLGYMAAVLDNAPEGVVVVDRSRFITYANPAMAEMGGWRVDELVDRPLVLFLSSQEELEHVAESLLRSEEQPESLDLEVRRRDGSPLRVSVSAKPLCLPDGTQMGAVAYVRDVTELRRAQEELERKNAELEHCVHAVSHDLRSPLVAMLGFARLLREDYADALGDKGQHFLRRIEEAGRTMEALLHDILELSRIGKTPLQRVPVDPLEVLQQLRAELKPRLDEASIELLLPEHPPLLRCDRTQLYQVLTNLVGNAIDHMGARPDAQVEVQIETRDDQHTISVRDNGRGIERQHHARIFELFQSLGTGAGGRRGTGIGLAVVRKIAETHGGRAWVESEPGAGSTFRVTFSA